MDYTKWLFKLNYHFKGGFWNPLLKKLAMRNFMTMRKEFADIFNENIDALNKQWLELHQGIKRMEEGTPIYNEYNKYIFNKISGILNLYGIKDSLFKAGMDPETCDFRLIFRYWPKMYVDYDFTPIKKIES